MNNPNPSVDDILYLLRRGINGEVAVTYKDYPLFKGPSQFITYFGNCTVVFFDDGGGCLKYVESASDAHGNVAVYSDWHNAWLEANKDEEDDWFRDPIELLSDAEYIELLDVLQRATKKD
ncbi:hypothetical protein [Achromobacter phage Motura]|uniref:Uncharacterized protein n=1 Tax=Achromobacter phage Motura TaxID=2591403 RepID=A0A514CSI8_9CAUD|nr:hypothetical protein H1O15_gp029 [Achromobacter phage Motura]QDH83437.1 hypothetical protein [Achromobacter phage Motura]